MTLAATAKMSSSGTSTSPGPGSITHESTHSPNSNASQLRSPSEDATFQAGQSPTGPTTSSSSPASGGAGGGSVASLQTVSRVRRRNRMITSCLECRRRKLKCDKQHPCANCIKTKRDCVFLAPALDSASQLKLTEIKEKMGSLERVLEQEVGRNGAWREARRGRALAASPEEEADIHVPEDEKDLEPTPLSVADAVYEKGDDDLEDVIADLGFAMGKMRLTDRIGGFLRPKFKEEMDLTLANIPGAAHIKKEHLLPDRHSCQTAFGGMENFVYLQPGPTYLPPSSSMYFSGDGKVQSLMDFLPAESAADYLVEQYRQAVHPIAKIVHWGSFQKRYTTFWDEIRSGIEPVGSLQALVFSVMFCGVVTMSEEATMQHFAATKKELVDHFQQGVETALGRAQFLRTTKLETMQAFVTYMIPLCRDQLSRAHSALVGTAIRLAECMGLHRDGSGYGMSAVETHVRRMIWYQLCMLDIRTCEAHGPRPGIREDDFDTRFPLNVNDAELERVNPPSEGAMRWTDMTCTLIRIECNEMIRTIWTDRPRVEKKIISLTSLIARIETFRRNIQERYFQIMDTEIPLHKAARLMLIILTTRMHIMVLHRYQMIVGVKIPERLRQIIRTTGLESIEAAIAFETDPLLAQYRWFAGALQQYQVAFLLLAEIYVSPNSREADRIWHIIDYVFEPPPHLTSRKKSLLIMLELRDRMDVYYTSRKLRASTGVVKQLAKAEETFKELQQAEREGLSNRPNSMGYREPAQPVTTASNPTITVTPENVHYRGTMPPYEDPDGAQHVNAIMGAVGLGQNPLRPNLDWGQSQTSFGGAISDTVSPTPGSFAPTGQTLPSGMSSVSGGGAWQDFAQSARPGAFPIGGKPNDSPPNVSDEVMAEIDWTEWDKLFPPTDGSTTAFDAQSIFPPR